MGFDDGGNQSPIFSDENNIPTPTKDDFQFGEDDPDNLFSPSPHKAEDVSSPRTQDELFFVSPMKAGGDSETEQQAMFSSDTVNDDETLVIIISI